MRSGSQKSRRLTGNILRLDSLNESSNSAGLFALEPLPLRAVERLQHQPRILLHQLRLVLRLSFVRNRLTNERQQRSGLVLVLDALERGEDPDARDERGLPCLRVRDEVRCDAEREGRLALRRFRGRVVRSGGVEEGRVHDGEVGRRKGELGTRGEELVEVGEEVAQVEVLERRSGRLGAVHLVPPIHGADLGVLLSSRSRSERRANLVERLERLGADALVLVCQSDDK